MSDLRSAVHESVGDAFASTAAAGMSITALIVAALFLGAHVLSTHRQVAAAMRVAGLVTALTGLTLGVRGHGWLTGLDTATTSWFVAHQSGGFDAAALVITDLGSPVATAAAGVICGALLCWRARSVVPGVVVVGTVAAATLASTLLKTVVGRPRPPVELQLVLETDHSFPSGHVTGTAALLGMIAVCVGVGRSRIVGAWLAGLVIAGVLLVAVSRVYLGVHWLTDVAAGALLAAVFVTIGAAVFGALNTRSGQHGTAPSVTAPAKACR